MKLKKVAVSIGLAASLTTPSAMSTGLPTADFANLVEAISANIQRAQDWVEESSLMTTMMQANSLFSQTEMSLNAFLAQTTTQAKMKLQEQLYNNEVKEMSEPDKDAPSTCVLQDIAGSVDCVGSRMSTERIDKFTATHANFGKSPKETIEDRDEIIKKLVDSCKSLQYADNNEDTDPLSTSMCLRSGIITGVESDSSMTEMEKEAADLNIDLLVGATPSVKQSSNAVSESQKNQLQLNEMREIAFRSLAKSSLENISAMRTSAGENDDHKVPSQIELLDEFVDERWGDPEWMTSISATSPDINDVAYPTELQRKMVTMEAFNTHLNLLRYKQSLRSEALQAATLLLTLEKK